MNGNIGELHENKNPNAEIFMILFLNRRANTVMLKTICESNTVIGQKQSKLIGLFFFSYILALTFFFTFPNDSIL